jgi:hypothetical protein
MLCNVMIDLSNLSYQLDIHSHKDISELPLDAPMRYWLHQDVRALESFDLSISQDWGWKSDLGDHIEKYNARTRIYTRKSCGRTDYKLRIGLDRTVELIRRGVMPFKALGEYILGYLSTDVLIPLSMAEISRLAKERTEGENRLLVTSAYDNPELVIDPSIDSVMIKAGTPSHVMGMWRAINVFAERMEVPLQKARARFTEWALSFNETDITPENVWNLCVEIVSGKYMPPTPPTTITEEDDQENDPYINPETGLPEF